MKNNVTNKINLMKLKRKVNNPETVVAVNEVMKKNSSTAEKPKLIKTNKRRNSSVMTQSSQEDLINDSTLSSASMVLKEKVENQIASKEPNRVQTEKKVNHF